MSRFFHDEKVPEKLAGKQRVDLLKALEGKCLVLQAATHASSCTCRMRRLWHKVEMHKLHLCLEVKSDNC